VSFCRHHPHRRCRPTDRPTTSFHVDEKQVSKRDTVICMNNNNIKLAVTLLFVFDSFMHQLFLFIFLVPCSRLGGLLPAFDRALN